MKWIVLCFLLVQLPIANAAGAECSQSSLEAFKAGDFKENFNAGNFSASADLLQQYLETSKCEAKLTGPEASQESINAYLEAVKDVAQARWKAHQFPECIAVSRQLIRQTASGFEASKNKLLKTALQETLKTCEEGRMKGLTSVDPKTIQCPLNIHRGSLDLTGFGEGSSGRKFKIFKVKSVSNSFGLKSKGHCIALIEIEVTSDDLNLPPGVVQQKIPYLIKADPKKISHPFELLPAMNNDPATESLRCGDFSLKPFKNKEGHFVFQVEGDFENCRGGTMQGTYDSLWVEDHGLEKKDEIKLILR